MVTEAASVVTALSAVGALQEERANAIMPAPKIDFIMMVGSFSCFEIVIDVFEVTAKTNVCFNV